MPELALTQWVGQIGRLSRYFAPRVKCLMCLRSSATRPARTSRLLSCHRSVGGLRLASPAQFFAKLRSDKNQAKRSGSSFRAGTYCSRYVDSLAGRTCVMFAKWTEARTQELHRLCPLFADRTQEDGKQTGRGQAHMPASHALTGQLLRLQWLMARPQPP